MNLTDNLDQAHTVQLTTGRKHVHTVVEKSLKSRREGQGCGECQTSCQSACKTSCTVGNQVCAK